MSFVSVEFLALFATVFSVYWSLPFRAQNLMLVAASLVFYGWFDPRFVLLLLYSAVLDFGSGYAMDRFPTRKRWFLWTSVVGNFGLLAIFKYCDFFLENVAAGLDALGVRHDLTVLGIVLPAGISFYTFQTLGYSIDVYRGRIKACRDPLDFLLFVSYFPQLVAGPISRAGAMLPQLTRPRAFDLEGLRGGLGLALWGAFKKVVIADTLAGFVNPVFLHEHPSGGMVWAASAAATLQMFADFSGYTDLARGTSRMLGIELAKNFDAPFLAKTPNEWWTRWHITFYDWVNDYVFQPLVLTPWCRKFLVLPWGRPWRSTHMVRGIVGSMLFSGVWHGAQWHYVLWGAFFAVVQLLYWGAGQWLPRTTREWPYRAWVQRPAMIVVLLVSGLLFREPDLGRLARYFTLNPLDGTHAQNLATFVLLAMVAVCGAPLLAHWYLLTRFGARLRAHPARLVLETTAWTLAAWAIVVFVRGSGSDFEYFRF